jgi:hypothetical protein
MVKTILFVFVALWLLSCGIRKERIAGVDLKLVAIADIFSVTMLDRWNESTRKNALMQKETCDSSQVYARVANFLTGFNISESGVERNTPRAEFLEYLRTSGILPDSLKYNSIYIAESSFSGERLYLINSIAVVGDENVKLYSFEYTRGGWKMQNTWDSKENKIKNLFHKLNCSTLQCNVAVMDSNENIIVSEITSTREVESRVIIKTCKKYIQEINDWFKLGLLGY